MNRHDRDMEAREKAGLPVLTCPCCGARVTRTTGHLVPETIGENGLRVDGHYTCQPSDETGEALW